VVRKNFNGIAFALSSSDLLAVLRRFYPSVASPAITTKDRGAEGSSTSDRVLTETSAPASEIVAPAPSSEGFGQLNVISEPDGAKLYVDGKFLGNTPTTLRLAAGSHRILMKLIGSPDYVRIFEVPKSSKLTLKASFETKSPQQ
jgi:hypothetical protein